MSFFYTRMHKKQAVVHKKSAKSVKPREKIR
jgi:hypothetical protein